MSSPPFQAPDESPVPIFAEQAMTGWVRGTLIGIALGWLGVFAIAAWLSPYHADGEAMRMETHRQLGLPPCTFKVFSSYPCPSCGMTTSFALLIHGDVINSLRANWVGTLLASCGLAFIPWSLASAARRRYYFIESLELTLIKLIVGFLILLLLRWSVVVAWTWLDKTG